MRRRIAAAGDGTGGAVEERRGALCARSAAGERPARSRARRGRDDSDGMGIARAGVCMRA